ncbi:hypothetical protein J1614_007416 [Plenodomus biglobosus]|nr:hypothetical protein J1614_007416 [Plenodomus biglobosus]
MSSTTTITTTTTTASPLTHQIQHLLSYYELTHSPNHEEDTNSTQTTSPNPSSQAPNPSDWPTEHRRVPAYRPVNTELDQSARRVYQNGIERAFLTLMFTGVFLQSVGEGVIVGKGVD